MNKKEQEAFAEKESNYGKVWKVAGPRKIFTFPYYFYAFL